MQSALFLWVLSYGIGMSDSARLERFSYKAFYAELEQLSEHLLRVWWDRQWISACRPKDIRSLIVPLRIPLIDEAKGLHFVVPIKGYVNSGFGFRRGWQFHFGLDIDLKIGDTVVAAMDGEVRLAGYDPGGYGYFCVIAHPNGLETVYGHFSRLLVGPEQLVRAGEPIGLGGSTGRSTGPHLHFEVRFMGEPIDVSSLIDFQSGELLEREIHISAETFGHLETLAKAFYHIVRRGETLSSIGKRYGVSVRYLAALNGLSPRSILRVGQRLRVR
ncbi:MAG: M23 family metallopeptidase [Bacteroidia bacterium]|nr:M23 family metallopeptidase [Bacteroidia bacterium]MDW8015043.1 M23 family metallopeptidase [Bacteroidia bacterium]